MRKNSIVVVIMVALLGYSCQVAKTCPTYSKAPKQSLEVAHVR